MPQWRGVTQDTLPQPFLQHFWFPEQLESVLHWFVQTPSMGIPGLTGGQVPGFSSGFWQALPQAAGQHLRVLSQSPSDWHPTVQFTASIAGSGHTPAFVVTFWADAGGSSAQRARSPARTSTLRALGMVRDRRCASGRPAAFKLLCRWGGGREGGLGLPGGSRGPGRARLPLRACTTRVSGICRCWRPTREGEPGGDRAATPKTGRAGRAAASAAPCAARPTPPDPATSQRGTGLSWYHAGLGDGARGDAAGTAGTGAPGWRMIHPLLRLVLPPPLPRS